jgi:hypothetical protein
MFRQRCIEHQAAPGGASAVAVLWGFLALSLLVGFPASQAHAVEGTLAQAEEPASVLAMPSTELALAEMPVPASSLLQAPPVSPMAVGMRPLPAAPEDRSPQAVPLPAPLAGAAVVFAILLIRRHIARRRA